MLNSPRMLAAISTCGPVESPALCRRQSSLIIWEGSALRTCRSQRGSTVSARRRKRIQHASSVFTVSTCLRVRRVKSKFSPPCRVRPGRCAGRRGPWSDCCPSSGLPPLRRYGPESKVQIPIQPIDVGKCSPVNRSAWPSSSQHVESRSHGQDKLPKLRLRQGYVSRPGCHECSIPWFGRLEPRFRGTVMLSTRQGYGLSHRMDVRDEALDQSGQA